MQQRHALTLFELNSMVRSVIENTMTRAYWVEAELSEVREVRGHCYMELVQKDIFSATPVARASAKCWRSTWQRLRPKFERETGQTLHAGIKVMLSVTANFHEAYGFSWIVQDIDPAYTLGDMARKRLEIIRQLKAEGVFDLQRELSLPMFAQRVAVVSSENAAGYGDFCRQLLDNDYGFAFHVELFPAVMQGDQVEPTVIAALNDIYGRMDDFDVVVIIRGGGAVADMSGFDTLALAENVANFPLPVITGIGHDRDESVLDMVSNTRVKTPTAAAALLVDNLAQVGSRIEDLRQRAANSVRHRMDIEKSRLHSVAGRIPILFSLVRERQEARLGRLSTRITSLMQDEISEAMHHIIILEGDIPQKTDRLLTRENNRLSQLSLRLKALDPALLLRRGYSITLRNGRAVHSAEELKSGDEIVTRVERGTFKSVVK